MTSLGHAMSSPQNNPSSENLQLYPAPQDAAVTCPGPRWYICPSQTCLLLINASRWVQQLCWCLYERGRNPTASLTA